jgi:hypothetical protein
MRGSRYKTAAIRLSLDFRPSVEPRALLALAGRVVDLCVVRERTQLEERKCDDAEDPYDDHQDDRCADHRFSFRCSPFTCGLGRAHPREP